MSDTCFHSIRFSNFMSLNIFLYYTNIKLASEMAHQVRLLAAKPDDLNWVSEWDPCGKWRELVVL